MDAPWLVPLGIDWLWRDIFQVNESIQFFLGRIDVHTITFPNLNPETNMHNLLLTSQQNLCLIMLGFRLREIGCHSV